MLDVSGLHAGYGAIPVLHDISLEIGEGESVGILGHNGMGKTTLLRTLIGALRIGSGRVTFAGVDVTRAAPHQRAKLGMAYVPQGREIFPTLSAMDNLRMGLVKTGEVKRTGATDTIDALLQDFPRLKPLLDRAGGSLSGGQGSVAGAILGGLLMTVIKTGCTHLGLPNWVQEVLTGCIIVAAVAIDRLRRRRPG